MNNPANHEFITKTLHVDVNKNHLFLVINRNGSKPRIVNGHAFVFGYDDALKYTTDVRRGTTKTRDITLDSLSKLRSSDLVLATYLDKSMPNYREAKAKYSALVSSTKLINPRIRSLLVNDPGLAKDIGLTTGESGVIHLLAKPSKYNGYKATSHLPTNARLLGVAVGSITEAPKDFKASLRKKFHELFIFSAEGMQIESQGTVVLEVNKNKFPKQEYKKLIGTLGNAKVTLREGGQQNIDFALNLTNDVVSQSGFRILYRNNDKFKQRLELDTSTDPERNQQIIKENPDYETRSYLYSLPLESSLSSQIICRFIEVAQADKLPEYHRSQKEPNYPKFSRKVVGSSFAEEVLRNDMNVGVMFYSKHCHGCKKFGGLFEELARGAKSRRSTTMKFCRMNSDTNALDCAPNYPYTPAFLLYRNQSSGKEIPYVLRVSRLPMEVLRDFYEVTTSFQIIPRDVEAKLFANKA
jgi:hypothetical protein